ncbi:hypothetical protein OP10G_3003 [Fimbriimonas ginsengisoli Gsoil 348]|uniref:Uncharacterized protein n=1 Tax=Fimbriimonas ginsengisoli Gsoil 348 TaxID=661478 RepID=A0A068NSF2_FIMGI|nr:hypothetical protein OP10G_3003 [Fimbriimonas ginsengisoli Gsoil 348]
MVARSFAGMIGDTIQEFRASHGPVAAVISVRSLHSTPELGYRTRGLLVAEAEGVPGLLSGIAREVVDTMDNQDPTRRAVVIVYDEAMVPGRTCTVFELDLRTGGLIGDERRMSGLGLR